MIGKIQRFTSKHRYAIILIIIAVITHVQWFNPWSLLESGDWQFRFSEHVRQLFGSWGTWIGFQDIGAPNIQLYSYPLRGFIWPLLSCLGFSYDVITKLTLFLPIALGGLLIPYYVGRKLIKNDFIAFAGALFYATTTYFLIMQTRHLFIAIIYILLPVFFYTIYALHAKNRLHTWVVAVVLFSVGIFYELRVMYIVFAILGIYVLYALLTKDIYKVKPYIKALALASSLLILVNAFWILPTLLGSAGDAIAKTANRGLFGDPLFDMSQAFTVFRWSWTGGFEDRSFVVQQIQWYLWLPPLVAFSNLLYKHRYRKEMLFFAIIAIVGLFLTKQSSPPFSWSYLWLYEHFPGFNLFREASKFYVITAFAYWGLIVYGLKALKESSFKLRSLLYGAAAVAVIGVAFINLKPLFTREIGGTFVSTQLPSDYVTLKNFLLGQQDYSRTLWTPLAAPWSYYDNNHPKLTSALELNDSTWKFLGGEKDSLLSSEERALYPLKQPLGEFLLNNISVKYVVVPIRYQFHYDDQFIDYGGRESPDVRRSYISELNKLSFLKKIDIGTKELVVYENRNYKPYINTFTDTYLLRSLTDLPATHQFLASTIQNDVNFTDIEVKEAPLRSVHDLSAGLATSSQQNNNKFSKDITVAPGQTLYANTNYPKLSYTVVANAFSFYTQQKRNVELDNSRGITIASPPDRQLLTGTKLNPRNTYTLAIGDRVVPLALNNTDRSLGSVKEPVQLFSKNTANLIVNPSFENGLWPKHTGDCSPGNPTPPIAPALNTKETTLGRQSISLPSFTHLACAHQEIPVTAEGAYGLSFDYKVKGSQRAGYEIVFNDARKTTIKESLAAGDTNWRSLTKLISVPKGATTLTMYIYGYPNRVSDNVVYTLYDNFQLNELTPVLKADVNLKPDYQPVALPENGNYTLTYTDPDIDHTNLIPNPSFENGLWQKKVKDCNAYDNRANLGMRTATVKTDGQQSLELKAKLHTACTGPSPISLKENKQYRLQFDYQSPNAPVAGYYLSFNDPAHTTIHERLPLDDSHWHKLTKYLQAPLGATQMKLTVYSFGSEPGNETFVNRYDNFSLIETPDIRHQYYLVDDQEKNYQEPASVTYDVVSGTKKTVRVTGARTPFYVAMNEAYNKKWRLELNNDKVNGVINSTMPWATPDGVPTTAHFMLNGFANGWYVDPAQLCKDNAGCKLNNDGSYDLNMTIEFTPQRWFYLGSIASVTTMAGIAAYLTGSWRARKKQKGAPGWRR